MGVWGQPSVLVQAQPLVALMHCKTKIRYEALVTPERISPKMAVPLKRLPMKALQLSVPLFGCTVAVAVMVMTFLMKASA